MTTKSQSMKARLAYLEEQVADYERNRDLFLATAKRKDELASQLYAALKDVDYYKARADRAEARVAKLQAARRWRPASENPPASDSYLVYREAPPDGEPWNYEFGIWDDSGWDVGAVTHWQPLPPPLVEATP